MRMLSTKIGAPSEIGRDWHIILVSAIGCGLGYAALVFYTFGLFIDRLEQIWLEPRRSQFDIFDRFSWRACRWSNPWLASGSSGKPLGLI